MFVQQVQKPLTAMTFTVATETINWREAASKAFRETERDELSAVRANLAARVHAFTGFSVAPASIHVDPDTRVATVALDNVLFRLRRGKLTLVRPCGSCGLGEFESTPLEDLADLGQALETLEPRCAHCPEGDIDDATSTL
jgi:hypothetical protein